MCGILSTSDSILLLMGKHRGMKFLIVNQSSSVGPVAPPSPSTMPPRPCLVLSNVADVCQMLGGFSVKKFLEKVPNPEP